MRFGSWSCGFKNVELFEKILSQWPTLKLLGITYLVGKIKFKLLFHGLKWLSKDNVGKNCDWFLNATSPGENLPLARHFGQKP